jgi:hypothetical protein
MDNNRKILSEAILQAFDPASLTRTLAEGPPAEN